VKLINRRLPTFIIGGAPRSGTTFLCHVLDKHPDVFMAKPFSPEPKICLKQGSQEVENYHQQYHALFANVKNEKALGEKSSAYLENQVALEQMQRVFNKHKVRFLFIVREPVQRAYSNYVRSVNNGLETLSFSEAIALEGKRTDPFPPERSYVRPFDYLIRSDYAIFAERYLFAFGRENVKFVLFENIRLSPDQFYYDIQNFIEVDPLPRAQLETGPINANQQTNLFLDPALEATLRKQMRPKVERFAQVTGLDVGAWGY
jgi:hypothetical protein